MDLPWVQAKLAVKGTLDKIEEIAAKSLATLIREIEAGGLKAGCVGIVGAGDRNLEKIGSTHIRAHAAEGLWFRQVLELAASACQLPARAYDERRLNEVASAELKLSTEKLSAFVTTLGCPVGRPWRADEKAATIAAWLALISVKRSKSR
jgi:hypothetical protein